MGERRVDDGMKRPELFELRPLVGMTLSVVSYGLDHAFERLRALEDLGYRVSACGDPAGAAAAILHEQPESILIDLAREVGFPAEVTQHIRQVSDAPIVVVGCAGTGAELVRTFEAGADDYCRPGSSTDEIDLRLRALWRRIRAGIRVTPEEAREATIRVGALEIDRAARVVRKNGELISLSPTEYRLLLSLAERPGEVVPSKALISRVWGNQYAGEAHYLRLYVRYLRQKLEDDPAKPRYILNRWGSGYTLGTPDIAA